MRSVLTRPFYHGWLVVCAAFLIALFGWGLGFYGPGIYLVALQECHGWPGAGISFAITTYYLAGATLILFAGGIFERLGARRVVTTGAVAMACGVALLTLVRQPWQVYAAFAVMSLGWAAMSGAAINIIVAPWFERRRGFAVSLALNGASAGGVVIAPLIILLMSRLGFSAALWCAAVLMLAVVLPTTALVLRPKRADEHDRADEVSTLPCAPKEAASGNRASWRPAMALYDRRFLTIAMPFAFGLTAQVGFLTHQVAFLSPLMGTVAAGWAVSLTTFAAIVGRIAMGAIVDRVDRRGSGVREPPAAGRRAGHPDRHEVSANALSRLCAVRGRRRQHDLAAGADRAAGVSEAGFRARRQRGGRRQPVHVRVRTRAARRAAAGRRQLHSTPGRLPCDAGAGGDHRRGAAAGSGPLAIVTFRIRPNGIQGGALAHHLV
jgi:MFS family permease